MKYLLPLALLAAFAIGCGPKDQCEAQADCDDADACTADACVAGQCQNDAVANLDDNDACTADACDPVAGVTHTPIAGIDDNNACTTDACDPNNGNITHDPLAAIDDNDACTADACDPNNGNITHTPLAAINDNNACTTDACDPNNGNITNTPVDPSDNNACTTDSCDPNTGVSNVPIAGINDNDACTTDACDPNNGNITHTPLAGINDNDACTTDACDSNNGNITHTPLAAINDNDACTTDACDPNNGNITHTPLAAINDGVACTDDDCDPANGSITHTANDGLCLESDGATCSIPTCDVNQGCVEQPDNTACDDSQACTTADVCDPANGASDPVTGCAFTANNASCSDSVACTDDVCTPFAGCDSTPNDNNCNVGEFCDETSGCLGNVAVLAQGVITEFVALGVAGNVGELIELHNPGITNGDLDGGTITNGANDVAVIHPVSNPTGTGVINVPPGGFVFGVPNPSNPANIPPGAAFVYGDPGTTFEIGDAGDNLVLRNRDSGTLDVVNFVGNFVTDASVPFTSPNAFPGFAGASTQLDPAFLNAVDNGDGANWCTTFRLFDTAGAANLSCSPTTVVINELVYDGALGADTADPRKTFIELAGPGGARVADLRVRLVETDGAQAGNLDGPNVLIGSLLANARVRPDGFFVIADNTGGDSQTVAANERDIQTAFDPENGSQAVQLLLEIGGSNFVDAVAYVANIGELDDTTDNINNLPIVEGAPALDANQGVSIARNLLSDDANDNSIDFVTDPTPSPGVANQPVNTTIISVTPDDGVANTGQTTNGVVLTGTDLGFGAAITFAGVAGVGCNFGGIPTTVTCNVPAPANGAAVRGNVVYTNTADRGGTVGTLTNGWTFTGALNELDVAGEADFCDLQFPFTTTTTVNVASENIFGQIFELGVTNVTVGGPAPGIIAELGVGPQGVNPTSTAGWLFSSTQFNVEAGVNNNNDEYRGTLTLSTPGTFSYTYRFSLDGGVNFTYCDQGPDAVGDGGSGSDPGLTFDPNNLGAITVNP